MSMFCDVAHDRPRPLGTVLECGCVVRAVLIACYSCGVAQWGASATDVEIGGQVEVKGACPRCGSATNESATVYKAPVPAAFQMN